MTTKLLKEEELGTQEALPVDKWPTVWHINENREKLRGDLVWRQETGNIIQHVSFISFFFFFYPKGSIYFIQINFFNVFFLILKKDTTVGPASKHLSQWTSKDDLVTSRIYEQPSWQVQKAESYKVSSICSEEAWPYGDHQTSPEAAQPQRQRPEMAVDEMEARGQPLEQI